MEDLNIPIIKERIRDTAARAGDRYTTKEMRKRIKASFVENTTATTWVRATSFKGLLGAAKRNIPVIGFLMRWVRMLMRTRKGTGK